MADLSDDLMQWLNARRDLRVSEVIHELAERIAADRALNAAPAQPLTDEQIKAVVADAGYQNAHPEPRADFINGIRHGERAHGITGEQHGT